MMTVLRIDRFTADPAAAEELRSRHAALVSAARTAFPGLLDVRLARVDERTWMDVWRWDELASAEAAVQAAPSIPEAGAAFALAGDLVVEFAEILQEPRERR
jgi:quinol monooxygenase YgiN